MELLDVAGEDVHHGFCDTCENNTLYVSVCYSQSNLLVKPFGEMIIVKVAYCDVYPI
jgi:hypothetical protein